MCAAGGGRGEKGTLASERRLEREEEDEEEEDEEDEELRVWERRILRLVRPLLLALIRDDLSPAHTVNLEPGVRESNDGSPVTTRPNRSPSRAPCS